MDWSNIITKDLLSELYFEKNMNISEISRHFGCTRGTVHRYFSKFNVKKKIDSITIDDVEKVASLKGGKCLSNDFIDSKTKLKWRCKKGHEWEQTWESVQKNRWCRRCSSEKSNESRKLSIELFKEIAKSKKGICLSDTYVNNHTKLKFKCKRGHIWESIPKIVKDGSWCKKCTSMENQPRKLTMDEMHRIAKERGGKCLSSSYVNTHTKLKWKCVNGHIWDATPHSVKNHKSWCNTCLQLGGLKEEKCRTILEQIFNVKFPKTRKVLGGNLELDGFNEILNLAFEYHGEQHYYFIKSLHKSEEKLKKRMDLDLKKMDLCKKKHINLLIVPYWVSKTDEYLINFIFVVLKKMNFDFNESIKINFDENKIYESKMKKLHDIASEKEGKCLDDIYKGSREYYHFECKRGHQWKAKAVDITSQGTWCQKCNGNNKYTIEQMHLFAKEMNGSCLSKEYINLTTPLEWKCEHGHIFKKPFVSISSRNTWCFTCRKNNKDNIKAIVKKVKETF